MYPSLSPILYRAETINLVLKIMKFLSTKGALESVLDLFF
jgi:hypothetical protein